MFDSPNLRRRQQTSYTNKNKEQQRQQDYRERYQQQRLRRTPRDGSTGSRSSNKKKDRKNSSPKQKFVLLLTSLAGMSIWYLTPISDWLSSLLLHQIPVEADIVLGQTGLLQFQYKTIYHPHWSPLVQDVGRELISILEASSKDILQETSSSQNLLQDILGVDEDVAQYLYSATTNSYNKQNNLIRRYNWDFGVIQAPIVNAFALPGGIIRVTDQLLETLSPTRGELAALLGHEIGHALHRHSQKRLVQQKMFQLVVQALTYEDHDDDDESFGEAMGELLLKSAQWLGQQKFSRNDEYQADATSWALLLDGRSPYNPKSVQSLLNKLWSLNGRATTAKPLDWMNTHPATEDRIGALQEKWEQLNRRERQRLEYRPI
jgi:Zn-dependent protease with chaperone function